MKIIILAFSFLSGIALANTLTDNEIATIINNANQAEIAAAQLAQKKAASREVKKFAEKMVSHHNQNLVDEKAVLDAQSLSLQSNADASQIQKDGEVALKKLQVETGGAFDRAYMSLQTQMHQNLLKDLKEKYIPQAQNPEFKSYLQSTATAVETHLKEAMATNASLSKTRQ